MDDSQYQIGAVGEEETPITLHELNSYVLAARQAAASLGFPDIPFDDVRVRDLPEVRQWLSVKQSLRNPIDLTPEGKLRLAEFNLQLEAETDRGQYVVGPRILKPSEALREIRERSPLSKHIINISIYVAKAIVETSGVVEATHAAVSPSAA